VCSGALSLKDAQSEIATNWLAVYQRMPKYREQFDKEEPFMAQHSDLASPFVQWGPGKH
jgi:hypothetical protein